MAATNNGSLGAAGTGTTVSTTDLASGPPPGSPSAADALYPEGIPDPRGTQALEEQEASQGENTDPTAGIGVEGEVVVWESSYSKRNFIGRGLVLLAVTIGWVVL